MANLPNAIGFGVKYIVLLLLWLIILIMTVIWWATCIGAIVDAINVAVSEEIPVVLKVGLKLTEKVLA